MKPTRVSLGGCEIINTTRMSDLMRACPSLCGPVVASYDPLSCWADRYAGEGLAPRYWGPGVALPWHRASVPESFEFIDFALIEWTEGQMLTRSPQLAASGGFIAGPAARKGREISVRVVAMAQSPAGLRWGIAWLTSVLESLPSCVGECMTIRTTCPPDGGDWRSGLWSMSRVTALGGVTEEPIENSPSCCIAELSFALVAESRWLSQCAEVCAAWQEPSATLSGQCFEDQFCTRHRVCCELTPNGVGRVATRITLRTFDAPVSGPIFVHRYADPNNMGCPLAAGKTPDRQMIVMGPIPAHHRLVLDASAETVLLVDALAQTSSDGSGLLSVVEGEGFAWMEADGCRPFCVCVEVPGSCLASKFEVQIETIRQQVAG